MYIKYFSSMPECNGSTPINNQQNVNRYRTHATIMEK